MDVAVSETGLTLPNSIFFWANSGLADFQTNPSEEPRNGLFSHHNLLHQGYALVQGMSIARMVLSR